MCTCFSNAEAHFDTPHEEQKVADAQAMIPPTVWALLEFQSFGVIDINCLKSETTWWNIHYHESRKCFRKHHTSFAFLGIRMCYTIMEKLFLAVKPASLLVIYVRAIAHKRQAIKCSIIPEVDQTMSTRTNKLSWPTVLETTTEAIVCQWASVCEQISLCKSSSLWNTYEIHRSCLKIAVIYYYYLHVFSRSELYVRRKPKCLVHLVAMQK